MKHLKKIFLGLLAALGTLQPADAQTDTVQYRISYETHFRSREGGNLQTDDMELLIGKRSSKFHSAMAVRQQALLDSLVRHTGGDFSTVMSASSSMQRHSQTGQHYFVYKNLPEEGTLLYIRQFMDEETGCREPVPDYRWQLLEGDTTIAEYACQKAQATFRGHIWTAWYTQDIPLSDGPWKLCGLPGLILKATTADGNFSFECRKLGRATGEAFSLNQKKTEWIEPKKMEQLLRMEVEDITRMVAAIKGWKPTKSTRGQSKEKAILIEYSEKE